MLKRFLARFESEEGQGLVEYALIIVLVGLIVMVGLSGLATQLNLTFKSIVTAITPA